MAIRRGSAVAASRGAGSMNHVWIITLTLTISLRIFTDCQDNFVKVTINETANISCGKQEEDSSIVFELFKCGVKIASSSFGGNQSDAANRTIAFEVASGRPQFMLYGPMVNRTGYYICRSNTKPQETNTSTIVFAQEAPQIKSSSSPELWPWAAAMAFLAVCALVITGIAVSIGCKLNSKDSSQNDYMNMKPRGVTSHRKARRPLRARRP